MYSKELYYQTQPQYDTWTRVQIEPFEKIKDFGLFQQGLIMCLVDIAILGKYESNKSQSFANLCQEIKKCCYSQDSSVITKMNEFLQSLEYIALTYKQSYEYLHIIKDLQMVQGELVSNFMKGVGDKIKLKTIKLLHKKINNILQINISVSFYDNKRKCYTTFPEKPKARNIHILLISYEKKLYLTLNAYDLVLIRPFVFEVQNEKQQISEIKTQIQIEEKIKQQFCSHCLMELTRKTLGRICKKHSCCVRCQLLNNDGVCFYCSDQL